MMDITGEVLLAKSKDNLQRQILDNEEKLRIMVDTIRTVAHEWRQPLNAISLASQNLLFELDFDENINIDDMKEILNDIQRKTQELSNVIASFQQIVELKGSKKRRSIREIINEAIKMADIDEENDEIIENFLTTEIIKTYPKELATALSAILKNAKEKIFEKGSGYIKIKTYKENDEKIVIEISNNGGHIPEKIKDKVYMPYFSTKEERNGVGLGLYIAKTIIELHLKGEIFFENIDSDVVRFTIKLPIGALE